VNTAEWALVLSVAFAQTMGVIAIHLGMKNRDLLWRLDDAQVTYWRRTDARIAKLEALSPARPEK
jgi:hypothetical protein